jgi:hypothetical protein
MRTFVYRRQSDWMIRAAVSSGVACALVGICMYRRWQNSRHAPWTCSAAICESASERASERRRAEPPRRPA